MFASEATASMVASVRSKFSEEAAWELKKSRSILCASYVYGYFHLDEHQGTKSLFALMQYELEDITEKLSELLQRQVCSSTLGSTIKVFWYYIIVLISRISMYSYIKENGGKIREIIF